MFVDMFIYVHAEGLLNVMWMFSFRIKFNSVILDWEEEQSSAHCAFLKSCILPRLTHA
jgi:hypothetical protein